MKLVMLNLIALYSEVSGWIDKGRAVGLVYLDFRKSSNIVSRKIITEKLMK